MSEVAPPAEPGAPPDAPPDAPTRRLRLPLPRNGRGRRRDASPKRGGALPLIAAAIALVAAGIGAIVIANSFDKPRDSRVLGPNLPINDGAANPRDLSANNSPTLVRNPVDSANLVLANRIDSPTYSCALHASFDGGGRWTQTAIPAPQVRNAKCFAPDVAFSSDGTLFVSFVTLKGRANAPDAVWISRSTDGGKTLTRPVRTPLGKRAFQVRLTADPKSPRRIFLTWLKASELGLYAFSSAGNPIMAIRSDDGGVNWTNPSQVSGASRQRVVAPSPAVGKADGELNVLYLDLVDDVLDYAGGHRGQGGAPYDGSWQLVLARSTDKGATWKESVVSDDVVPSARFIVFTPPFPSLAIDPGSGRAYASMADSRSGDADVRVWSLPHRGGDWSGPVRVNDTATGDKTAQYLPKLSVAPDGRLDVLYYDRRADRTNVLNEVSLQSSYDEGKSFSDRLKVSDRAFSSRIGSGLERKLPDLGSRLALISTDSRAYGVWTDTRTGSVRTAKQDLARGVTAFNDPPRLSGAGKTALTLGGIVLILVGIGVAVMAITRRPRSASV